MIKRILLLLIFVTGLHGTTALYAQRPPGAKAPLKWGKIPDEHLAMDHYAPDSNATAVVLADFGDVYFLGDGTVVFDRHTRIKILSEAGYDHGTVSIPYYADRQRGQRVRGVKGQTFTRGSKGKAVRHKMDKKAVFDEKLNGGMRRVHFTLPALEPGAVIEYVYTIESKNPIFLEGWQFQTSEPVLWSEYRAEIPAGYGYVRATVGILDFHIEKSQKYLSGQGVMHRWVMKDVSALREEPFMTTPEDYRAAIEFQLRSYSHPSVGTINFMNTWDEVAKELMGMPWFGKQLKPSRKLRERVAEITAGLDTPRDKMIAVYDFVRTNVVWDGLRNFVGERDIDEVLKTQRGNSAEVALLLVAMLRAADLEAHPVLISTRDHGQVIKGYPILSQFNSLLVALTISGETHLLDATDPLRPYDLLPYEALNGTGWLVHQKKHEWIPIKAASRFYHRSYFDATIDASGTLTGHLQTTDKGYSALDKRHVRKQTDTPQDFVTSVMLIGLDKSAIDSCTVTDEVVTEPLVTETTFSVPNYAQVAGDFIYLNPMPVGQVKESPLRLPERTFPVDVAYPRSILQTFRLVLPEGYDVQEMPKSFTLKLPKDGGHFKRVVGVEDGVLSMQMQFILKRSVYSPGQYQHLRGLYDRVVSAGAEQVVLKRTESGMSGGENQ